MACSSPFMRVLVLLLVIGTVAPSEERRWDVLEDAGGHHGRTTTTSATTTSTPKSTSSTTTEDTRNQFKQKPDTNTDQQTAPGNTFTQQDFDGTTSQKTGQGGAFTQQGPDGTTRQTTTPVNPTPTTPIEPAGMPKVPPKAELPAGGGITTDAGTGVGTFHQFAATPGPQAGDTPGGDKPVWSTSTPDCSGTAYEMVVTTTVTVTQTSQGHGEPSDDPGPLLILPTPACRTITIPGDGRPVGPFHFANPTGVSEGLESTETITATVKTAQFGTSPNEPAATFANNGVGIEPQAPQWNGAPAASPNGINFPATAAAAPGGDSPKVAHQTQNTAQPQDTANAQATSAPTHKGAQKPAVPATTETSTGLGSMICQAFGGCAKAGTTTAAPAGTTLQPAAPNATPNNVNSVPVVVHSGGVVVGSSTFTPDASSTQTAVVNGQTFTVLPSGNGVVAPGGMTISPTPAAAAGGSGPTTPPSVATMNDVVFTADPTNLNQILVAGSTLSRPASGSSTITAQGHTFTVGPTDIAEGGSTVALPDAAPSGTSGGGSEWVGTTIDNIAIDIGTGAAVVGGTTIPIGVGAPVTSITASGIDLTIGPQGIIFPSTTVAPLVPSIAGQPYFSAATGETISADGALFSFAPTDVVIDGTTYPYATPTEVVVGGGQATVGIGTNGLRLIGSPTSGSAEPSVIAANDANRRELGSGGIALLAFVFGVIIL